MSNGKINISNEVKIGFIVLLAIIIGVVGFRIMRDQPLFRQANLLYTNFERVDALLPGSIVQVQGLKIGTVRSIEYQPQEKNMLVTLSITGNIPITVGSKAKLVEPGIFGAVTIEIIRAQNAEVIEWESFIEGDIQSSIFESLSDKGDTIADELTQSLQTFNSLLIKVDSSLFSAQKDPIGNTLSNFEKMSVDVQQLIEKRKSDIDSMIVSMSNITKNMDEISGSNKAEIDSMLTNLNSASAELEKLSKGLNKTTVSLNEILSKMNEGQGTLGKMVNDESLYNNLDSLSFNLNELIKNIQSDPKKYLKHMRLIEVF